MCLVFMLGLFRHFVNMEHGVLRLTVKTMIEMNCRKGQIMLEVSEKMLDDRSLQSVPVEY